MATFIEKEKEKGKENVQYMHAIEVIVCLL
jgi:hypothetical protein